MGALCVRITSLREVSEPRFATFCLLFLCVQEKEVRCRAHIPADKCRLFMPEAAQYPELLMHDNTQASDEVFEVLLSALSRG